MFISICALLIGQYSYTEDSIPTNVLRRLLVLEEPAGDIQGSNETEIIDFPGSDNIAGEGFRASS